MLTQFEYPCGHTGAISFSFKPGTTPEQQRATIKTLTSQRRCPDCNPPQRDANRVGPYMRILRRRAFDRDRERINLGTIARGMGISKGELMAIERQEKPITEEQLIKFLEIITGE